MSLIETTALEPENGALQSPASGVSAPAAERKSRILDAAERCFVRTGFHRATMQDVARECAMSPGNLYRYFASKDDLVAGLAGRDREEMQGDFAHLRDASDPLKTFVALGRRHLVEEPRAKSIMMQEIWAEASRNPRIAAISVAMDLAISAYMAEFISHWRARTGLTGHGAPVDVARLIMALADGLCRRRATDVTFDPASNFELALPVIFHMVGAAPASLSEVLS
jgi:TetR/AcrR family transcriptional regulator, repressor for uid operon